MSILRTVRTSIFGSALAAGLLVPYLNVATWAQSQSINGTIRGEVSDSTGAPIAGATVTVRNLDTGYTRTITSTADGLYIAPDLVTYVI